MKDNILKYFFDANKLKEEISWRGNLSTAGKDWIANPVIKLKRESESGLMISLLHVIRNSWYYPEEWKIFVTILLYKCDEKMIHEIWTGYPLQLYSTY
jgi:hypothetical protein